MDTEKEISQRLGYEESKPIHIPGSKPDTPIPSEYDLKQNLFDPNKSSPGSWNTRLYNRISYYDANKS